MDKRKMRERMRRKKRQMMIRKLTRLGVMAVAAILVVVFVIRGIILPIMHRSGGGKTESSVTEQQTVDAAETDPDAAVRQPLKGGADTDKITEKTPGWHDSENGRWYQNTDGTFYADGFQEIDGSTYYFDQNGYIQTGWVSKGFNDYYFNDDGTYNPDKQRPMLALTYDDGPGQYTDQLLDCLEENNAHATFFMLGSLVSSYPDIPKRMLEIGCELGSHSWDHTQLTTVSLDEAVKQYTDTDAALIEACGQASTVARAPYGSYNQEIIEAVGKPFFMWSLDSLDWSLLDAQQDYDSIMNGDLTDGSIILMHDIHQPSVEASLRIIPELVEKGYKLVTLSEMAAAKGVTLQSANYSDFWASSLNSGQVAGYEGSGEEAMGDSGSSSDSSDSGSYDNSYDSSYDNNYDSENYDESYGYNYDSYDSDYSE